MGKITLHTLATMKAQGEKITCLTSYDATFTQCLNNAGVEMILVGDSLGMVLQGHDSTLPVSLEDMVYHARCVKAGNSNALLMVDMPFMTYRSVDQALANATALMQAGGQIVKLEGGIWLAETIHTLSEQGIPVCAHLGLTPQAINKLGGYRIQGRTDAQARQLIDDAIGLEAAGASMILLECVPAHVGAAVSQAVSVPVVGIGAGSDTDAQVLVLHDMLGLSSGRQPRFVKNFLQDADSVEGAIQAYVQAVKAKTFPSAEHSFE